jgi:hypothetical protein
VTKRTRRCGRPLGVLLVVLLLAGCGSRIDAQPQFVERGAPQLPTVDPTPAPARSTEDTSGRTPTVALQVVTRTVTEVTPIAYPTRTVSDATLDSGTERVLTKGVPGVRTRTYRVTITNGRQTAKVLLRSVVTVRPVAMVVAIGSRAVEQRANCNANYSGCVPIAVDVDCQGGGNGPVYVKGPVKVVGIDIYHLDLDGNGKGCDGPADIP